MLISSLPKGGIYELNFGHHSKLGRYTTLMSDILTLYEIALMEEKQVAICLLIGRKLKSAT